MTLNDWQSPAVLKFNRSICILKSLFKNLYVSLFKYLCKAPKRPYLEYAEGFWHSSLKKLFKTRVCSENDN